MAGGADAADADAAAGGGGAAAADADADAGAMQAARASAASADVLPAAIKSPHGGDAAAVNGGAGTTRLSTATKMLLAELVRADTPSAAGAR